MIGTTVSHYKILEEIGHGGMGVVYKAEDTRLKRIVALKFLTPEMTRDSETKERFISEAQAASALEQNNICNIHEIDEVTIEGHEQMFIAMAYYEGETLNKKIKRGPLKLEDTLDIAIQIAEGLARAHEERIVHRDIKPANVIVTKRNVVKIVDFGLAKLAGGTKITAKGTKLGTAAYMSPEQARGEEVDYRTDIWSLGVVLYEMITGRLPFKGESGHSVMFSIIHEEPESITGLRTGVPVELERIVNKTLAKNPDERYQHVDEMFTDLKNLSKGIATSAQVRIPEVSEKIMQKKRLVGIIMPVGILLVFVLGFFLVRPLLFDEILASDPKPIAVISFENQTGDANYNYLQKAIPNLLITSLEQSKYLRVTTWERMHDLLEQLGKDEVEIVDRDLGFELCRIDGVDAIVLGSFVKAGDMFATDVKVLDVESKKILRSASSRGRGVGSILESQIDELSREISRSLDISEGRIEATQMRIGDVTTTSMEAYHYFVQGREHVYRYYYDEARQLLEKAVLLDTTFATAYRYLTWANASLGNIEALEEALNKAKVFSNRATEKERLYIEDTYALFTGGDGEKRFRINQQIAKKYPLEKHAHHAMAKYFESKRLFNQAIIEYNKTLELDPNFGSALNGFAYLYVQMGNLDKGMEILKRYASAFPGDANPIDSMAELYFRMGRLDEAIEKYREASDIKPGFSDWHLSYMHALKEDYTEAMNRIDGYIASAPSSGDHEAGGHWWKGFYHYLQGRLDLTLEDLRQAKALAEIAGNDYWIEVSDWLKGWIYYDRGEYDLTKKVLKVWFDKDVTPQPLYNRTYPAWWIFLQGFIDIKEDRISSAKSKLSDMKDLLENIEQRGPSVILTIYIELFRWEILMAESFPEKVVLVEEKDILEEIPIITRPTTTFLPYNIPFMRDVRARAHYQSGNLDKAIAEYERLVTFDPDSKDRRLINPRIHYRLGKLYEEKGLMGKAMERYEKFLNLWKDANEDLPDLVDAKTRLARLKGD